MRRIYKLLCVLGIVCCSSSCDDFLDILPMNDVVLENFWTQKSDVTSVLNSCYESMEANDCLTRMALWGELRSDNMTLGASTSFEVSQILKENILPTNSLCNWTAFYQTINRCNTVCHYAPLVQAKDPNYTEPEMKANVAEATALRSLCYFYLIRTFRDVPFSRRPSIDDTQKFVMPATKFDDVLDSLITDLEAVKDDAVRRYYTDDNTLAYTNSSRITRYAIYALLADLYLWKGDWDKCVAHCDLVLNYKKEQYEEMRLRDGDIVGMQLFNGYPLLMERPVGSSLSGNAYNEIFGTGNSFESLFELYFLQNQSVQNTFVSNYYGSNSSTMGMLSAPDFLYKDVITGNNGVFKKTDCRAYEGMQLYSARYAITKYARQTVSFNTTNLASESDLRLSATRRSTNYSNWVVYRMTDVMLMKAEAEIERGMTDDYNDAFTLINAVNKRANNVLNTSVSDTLKHDDYVTSKQAMQELVMAERQRELLFEGKRWYDLVRMSRRDGNTNRLVNLASQKYVDNINAIKIKLANPDIIYFPYLRSELKVNPYLVQNSAYNTGDDADLEKN